MNHIMRTACHIDVKQMALEREFHALLLIYYAKKLILTLPSSTYFNFTIMLCNDTYMKIL